MMLAPVFLALLFRFCAHLPAVLTTLLGAHQLRAGCSLLLHGLFLDLFAFLLLDAAVILSAAHLRRHQD